MNRAMLVACMPWLVLLLASFLLAWALARVSRARLRLGRLRSLHRDQDGSAQSLSFVLTLPIFVMVMLMIIQVSQLMIGTIIVHYAAFASARSAAVWIPASVSDNEGPNCISTYHIDPDATDSVMPDLDPTASDYGPSQGGVTYVIDPGSPKYDKITSAAVLACMAISPSRDVGLSAPNVAAGPILKSAYAALSSQSRANGAIPVRLDRKLAYAMQNTNVELRFYHKNEEPPLETYFELDDPNEFYYNEVGWQDLITVTVKYKLALLPGPGRLLARYVAGPSGSDKVSATIERQGDIYVYPLQASASIGNEGEKSTATYSYHAY